MPSSQSPSTPSRHKLRPLRRITLITTLSLSMSGCFTLYGAPMIDAAILGAGAAAMGIGAAAMNNSSAGGVATSAQTNSMGEPGLTHPQAQFYYARLRPLYDGEKGQPAAALFEMPPAADTVACELNKAATTQLLFQYGPEEFEALTVHENGIRTEMSNLDVTLLEGECIDGMPSGEFVSLGSYDLHTSTADGSYQSDNLYRVRLEGRMENGRLDGEVMRLLRYTTSGSYRDTPQYNSSNIGYNLRLGVYEAGEEAGVHVTYTENAGSAVTTVMGFLPEDYYRSSTWLGDHLFSSSYLQNDQLEGWMRTSTPGLDPDNNCYRNGQTTGDTSYCDEVDRRMANLNPTQVDYVALAPESTRALARKLRGEIGPYYTNPQAMFYLEALQELPMTAEAVDFDALAVSEPIACEFDRELRYTLMHQMSPADHEEAQALLAARPGGEETHLPEPQAHLIEGECVNGTPEGPFTALLRLRGEVRGGAGVRARSMEMLARGTLRDGQLEGQVSSIRRSITEAAEGGEPLRSMRRSVGIFRGGQPIGTHVNSTVNLDRPDLAANSSIFEYLEGSRYKATFYNGPVMRSETYSDGGIGDGWHRRRSDDALFCMQRGVQMAQHHHCATEAFQRLYELSPETPDYRAAAAGTAYAAEAE